MAPQSCLPFPGEQIDIHCYILELWMRLVVWIDKMLNIGHGKLPYPHGALSWGNLLFTPRDHIREIEHYSTLRISDSILSYTKIDICCAIASKKIPSSDVGFRPLAETSP